MRVGTHFSYIDALNLNVYSWTPYTFHPVHTPVSYTHLDVYKRQGSKCQVSGI